MISCLHVQIFKLEKFLIFAKKKYVWRFLMKKWKSPRVVSNPFFCHKNNFFYFKRIFFSRLFQKENAAKGIFWTALMTMHHLFKNGTYLYWALNILNILELIFYHQEMLFCDSFRWFQNIICSSRFFYYPYQLKKNILIGQEIFLNKHSFHFKSSLHLIH